MNYSEWIQGIPPVEAVAEHEKNHPANTSGLGQGYGNWLCVGAHRELVLYRLRAVNGEVLQSTGWYLHWTSPTTYRSENAKYFPVGADGLPINMRLTYCVYCGDQANYGSAEERNAGMLEHIYICEKRPEMKLLGVAIAAEEFMDAFRSDERDLAYYLSLPYTTTLELDEDGDVVAQISELPGCMADGADETEARVNLDSMKRLWLTDALENGEEIPEPLGRLSSAELAALRKLRGALDRLKVKPEGNS